MKELSIEEKAKAYDEALTWMRDLYPTMVGAMKEDAEHYFPELKESEDEKMRKKIIAVIDACLNIRPQLIEEVDYLQIKDWLEKQGEQKPTDKVESKFKVGDYVKNVNDKREPIYEIVYIDKECYICEYRGKENIGDKAIMHFAFDNPYLRLVEQNPAETVKWSPQEESCICQLESLVKEQWRYAERVHNSVNIKKMTELMFFLKTLNPNKKPTEVRTTGYWNVQDIEQKPADNVEPKFKVGEWISCYYTNYKVLSINNNWYAVEDIDGNKINILFENEKFYHLWTIQDAKDGDVLHSSSHHLIWIYKNNEHYHACVNMNYVTENVAIDGLISIPNDVCPATKNEQTILFARMKESGYKWDDKEKKPIKSEQSLPSFDEQQDTPIIDIPFSAKDNELQEVTYYIPKGFHAEIDADKVVIKKGEQKSLKVYRVENEAEERGLWRKFDGTWQPLFDMLTDGKCRDMPMEDNPIYSEGGKIWFASAPSKEALREWFSKRDLEELVSKGFTITEFYIKEYKKVSDFEYIFTRDNIISKKYLEISDIYPEQIRSWTKEDETALDDALWCCKQAASIAKNENDMGNVWYAETWLKSLKERVLPQPKQEWSDEDKKTLERVIMCIENHSYMNADDIHWLKSIKDRVQSKPKREWTEEDERMIRTLLSICDVYTTKTSCYPKENKDIERLKDWLKSLKPPYYCDNCKLKKSIQEWKPTDEQMEALDDFIYSKYPNTEKHGKLVKSLYQELQKLKGE